MTYRERRMARAERLRTWAESREAKSEAAYEGARRIADNIPLGQPILVGHHSERRHRRDIDRIHNGFGASFEHARKAESMRARADSIEDAADRAIYSDDPDAIERLKERIAELEAERESRKAANAAWKRSDPATRLPERPWPSYSLSNLSGNIARLRGRLNALEHPRPTWFHASRRDADVCYKCDFRKDDHTPHATVPSILMCPTR